VASHDLVQLDESFPELLRILGVRRLVRSSHRGTTA
jgi:hypothetical protein